MITVAGGLIVGLALLAIKGVALFLMVLGAMDIYYHIKENK